MGKAADPIKNSLHSEESRLLQDGQSPSHSAKNNRILQNIFTRYMTVAKNYSYDCSEDFFLIEAKWLMAHGWAETSGQATLHISSKPDLLDLYKIQSQFLLLHFQNDKQKKNVFPAIEMHDYRILHENGGFIFFVRLEKTKPCFSQAKRIDDPEIKQKLGSSFWSIRRLPQDTKIIETNIAAQELLTPRRLDIAIKANYARLWKSGAAKKWRNYSYYEQALRITGPDKGIREYDGSGKTGLEEFTNAFHSLLKEDTQKFPPFITDRNHIALDGAHRISAALLNQKKLSCMCVDIESSMDVSYDFFSSTLHGHAPCPEDVLDEAAIEYCIHKDSAAIALIFPSAPDHKPATDLLASISETVYKKSIVLSQKAGGALLAQAYLGQPWLTLSGKDTGFAHKQKSCFPFSGAVTVLLIDNFLPSNLRPVKEKIRSIYKLGNHSIHITDSSEETLRIARAVFNANSLRALDHQDFKAYPEFNNFLSTYRDWIMLNDIDENRLIVDSSAVLSALGLRECKDLDFLYHGNKEDIPPMPIGIDCHNDIAAYYDHQVKDMVGDPRLHFWYMGVKFCAPEIVYAMKKARNEPKDRVDANLLKCTMPFKSLRVLYIIRTAMLRVLSTYRARTSLFVARIKTRVRLLLRNIMPERF